MELQAACFYGKLQSLSMEAGALEENVKLRPCVLQWLKEDETRSNMARFGDKRRIRRASPGQDGPTLDQTWP